MDNNFEKPTDIEFYFIAKLNNGFKSQHEGNTLQNFKASDFPVNIRIYISTISDTHCRRLYVILSGT